MKILLFQQIIVLIIISAMHALSNDQTLNKSQPLSAVGKLELVMQSSLRCNFIMFSIDGEFDCKAATGGVL